ncbi:hypothetical protein [Nocardioides mangrovi]|uniref:WD40 repeat domain-containing protein n=1 Tax=Nocardioides mangrovi TaxID=2874580 RepID=A0ABS7UID1_9ACTN|nr:hypothetical protein [Nocardioides mangrovi]MBZ5740555.1 hypothetical protein [Nocardioides mangrovi]
MLDRLLGAAAALGFLAGAASAPAAAPSAVVFSFQDQAIVESSGLVLQDGLFLTINDSGDTGRVFAVDRSGRTVGVTSWGDATDVEAVAPAGDGRVWIGDIGDNTGTRSSVQVFEVPVGRGDRTVTPTTYDLTYPGGPRDAETLLVAPSGRLYVVSKQIFGAGLYVAPRQLSADHPNRLRRVPDVAAFAFATDGAFFPDGRHYVVRGYGTATVYTYPGHEVVGTFDLPAQRQGEGITVGPDDTLYLSSEGLHSKVLSMTLPRRIQRAIAPPASTPSATPTPTPTPEPAESSSASSSSAGVAVPWWAVAAGAGGVAFVALAGWLLLRRGSTP